VRLGTCIALELALAVGAAAGMTIGVGQIAAHAGDYLTTREAVASTAPARESLELPRSQLAIQAIPVVVDNVFGTPDAELLEPLGRGKVTRMKLNLGGTSLSLRLDFENGTRASFKPEQEHLQSDPRREIAAYKIDRLLGIGHVPPAKEIEVSLEELIAVAEPAGFRGYIADRIKDEGISRNGKLRGEASWWIPEIKLAAIGRHRIDLPEGRDIWTAQMQIGAPMDPALRPFLAQISTCILFDLLIDNSDRWSGSNTEMSPDGKTLYFMDNTLSFSKAQYGHEINVLTMRRIQIYSKSLVDKLRKLTLEDIERALAMPPDSKLAPLVRPWELKAIISRRDHMLRWIDQLIAKHGEAAVLGFP
jgi:hypothetical protein